MKISEDLNNLIVGELYIEYQEDMPNFICKYLGDSEIQLIKIINTDYIGETILSTQNCYVYQLLTSLDKVKYL